MNKNFLLSTHGTFHYFDLAKELNSRYMLNKIVSGYPKFKLKKYKLPYDKIHSTGIYQVITQTLGRYQSSNKKILDYFNNFISTQRFSEYYDLSMDEAKTIIIVGRKINHEKEIK